MPESIYRSAGYLAELHPDQQTDLEAVLEALPDSDPVRVSLGMLLGASFYVDLTYCTLCGATVHDDLQHGLWHDQLAAMLGGAK